VVKEGAKLEDHGTPGNLTAEESEQAIDKNRDTFVAFAKALREAGASMLAAADAKNPQGIIDAGDTLDGVCEGCHLKFWYPGQKIPLFPDQAPEEDAKQ
jgi:cytochrome c556